MASLKEIAAVAGVSAGTVDRVIHGRGKVAPKTERKILDAMQASEKSGSKKLQRLNLGVVLPHPYQDSAYWSLVHNGVKNAEQSLKPYGIKTRFSDFDRYDPQSFHRALVSQIDAGVDGLLVAPIIPPGLSGLPESLPPIVTVDTEWKREGVAFHVGQDSMRSGALAARLMLQLIVPRKSVLVVRADTESPHIVRRVSGFTSIIASRGVSVENGVREHKTDVDAFSSLFRRLEKNMGSIGGIFIADASVHLAASALERMGLGGLPLIGYDLLPQDVEFLERETISYLLTQNPVGQGQAGLEALFRTLTKRQGTESISYVPIGVVTKENYLEFLPKCSYPATI